MGKLSEYATKNSKWLSLEDGEGFKGKFKGYEMEKNRSGEDTPCYKFEDEYGSIKMLNSQSKALAKFFDEDDGKAKVGDIVKLTRKGKGSETRYEPELISQAGEDNEVPF